MCVLTILSQTHASHVAAVRHHSQVFELVLVTSEIMILCCVASKVVSGKVARQHPAGSVAQDTKLPQLILVAPRHACPSQ